MREFLLFMTDDKKKLLKDLEFRVKQVMYLCETLREDNLHLKSELSSTKEELDATKEHLDQLKQKYDSLKVARTITAASVDVETAKDKLLVLVREVDKCINLLSI